MVLCPAVLVKRGVGTSYMIPIEKGGRYFIHVPTKRVCGGCFVSRKHKTSFCICRTIKLFQMTSWPPYWCAKDNETAVMLVFQTSPVGVKLSKRLLLFSNIRRDTELSILDVSVVKKRP